MGSPTDSALSSFFAAVVGGVDGTAIDEVPFLLLVDSGAPVMEERSDRSRLVQWNNELINITLDEKGVWF